jgi:hypothetical protein
MYNLIKALILAIILLLSQKHTIAEPAPTKQAAPKRATDSTRDGSKDFDFAIGTWKTHIRRLIHPLTGSKEWTTFDGTVVTRKVWKGRAQLEEIEAKGPLGHFEGVNLFLYNPQARQWATYWANSDDGTIAVPTIGEFKNGRAELFDQETYNGRTILARGVWSEIKANTHRFEQSYSDDGGKTWETNFIAEKTLENPEPILLTTPLATATAATPPIADPAQNDFNFDFGTWNMHIRRLRHPLTDSSSWFDMTATTTTSKVWGGKANIAEVEADGPNGHLELLALRLYNPIAHQWAISFATSNSGVLSVPAIGEFKDGIGQFIDQEPYGDRTILVHFTHQSVSPGKAHSEQAFSKDGGKTWETNWINDCTRVSD